VNATLRGEFKKARNKFLHNRTHENKICYFEKKRIYNIIKRKLKTKHKREEGLRISKLAKNDPKSFWKNIKKTYKENNSNIVDVDPNNLFNHFHTLYGLDPLHSTEGEPQRNEQEMIHS